MTSSENPLPEDYRHLRDRMVDDQISRRNVKDPRVLEVIREVERHLFVPEGQRTKAYEDYPLPIGHGQTISQPYVVAVMTEQLELREGDTVLEIGTGSGYQTAVLARLCREVYTVEAQMDLAESARLRLKALGYDNIHYHVGDGSLGWPGKKQFDGILVTAAAPEIPEPLKTQLKVGGTMVIPLGDRLYQNLTKAKKISENGWETEILFPCAFVPLLGEHGFRDPF